VYNAAARRERAEGLLLATDVAVDPAVRLVERGQRDDEADGLDETEPLLMIAELVGRRAGGWISSLGITPPSHAQSIC
jgi:hypothetical protein